MHTPENQKPPEGGFWDKIGTTPAVSIGEVHSQDARARLAPVSSFNWSISRSSGSSSASSASLATPPSGPIVFGSAHHTYRFLPGQVTMSLSIQLLTTSFRSPF